MSQTQQPRYEFDSLPIEPVPSGTSLLVVGPPLGGTRELIMRLLACRDSEGLLFVTTDHQGENVIENYEAGGCQYDTSRMAVVDCTQDGTENQSRNIHSVSAPNDLTGIGMLFSSLYEQLYGAGIERVRTGLYPLAPLVMYVDEIQSLYRFLHTLTGRIQTAGGLGVSGLDPEALDDQTFRSLTQPFDAEVQLREQDGQKQLRVRGLPDQPNGWQNFEL